MTSKPKFKVGDRARLTSKAPGWSGYGDLITVHSIKPEGSSGHMARSSQTVYGFRFDDYDYGPGSSNHHVVGEAALEWAVPDNVEVQVLYYVSQRYGSGSGKWLRVSIHYVTEKDGIEALDQYRRAAPGDAYKLVKQTKVTAYMDEDVSA